MRSRLVIREEEARGKGWIYNIFAERFISKKNQSVSLVIESGFSFWAARDNGDGTETILASGNCNAPLPSAAAL